MIGGSPIGSDNIGSFSIDNFVFGARSGGIAMGGAEGSPSYSFSIDSSGIGVSGSVIGWAVVTVTLPGGMGISSGQVQSQVQGSIQFETGASGLGLSLPESDSDPVRGVPEFIVSRSPSTVTITVSNRQGQTIRLFRADSHNAAFSEITTFASDTFTDSGLDPAKNYKYKLAFTVALTPPLIGQRSISKFTKA